VEYGEQLGLAFQLVDDLLDLVGDPRVTGKEPGTDLKEGVYTMAVLLACAKQPDLIDILASGERHLDAILPILRGSGALDEAMAEAERRGAAAVAALSGLPGGAWKEEMAAIAEGVLTQVA
jgi:geranylgeranyl pyrophosphate synthase